MTKYCQEAVQYGEVPHPASKPFNKVLVILNPVADKRAGAKTVCSLGYRYRYVYLEYNNIHRHSLYYLISFQFEAYCAPLLHLAGIKIEVVKTDSVGHARRYIEELDVLPDAILVASGDGTLSEAVTGTQN